MSAVCTGPAVSPVPTLKAPTPAPVWRATCPSQTTAHARPRMVSTLTDTVGMGPWLCFKNGNMSRFVPATLKLNHSHHESHWDELLA